MDAMRSLAVCQLVRSTVGCPKVTVAFLTSLTAALRGAASLARLRGTVPCR